MKIYNSRDLKGMSRCSLRRSRNLELEDGKKDSYSYQKAVIIKQAIKEALIYGYNKNELEEKVTEQLRDILEGENELTVKARLEETLAIIERYLDCEDRTPMITESALVEPFGLCKVKVNDDFIFSGYKEFEYSVGIGKNKTTIKKIEPYTEVVKICCGLPTITQSGKVRDGAVNNCLELYTMLMHARAFVKDAPKNMHVGASYYFLRKKTDTTKFDGEFFDGGNVVTLWQNDFIDGTEIDAKFKPLFEEFLNGDDKEVFCSKKNCEHCEFSSACLYNVAPKPEEKKEVVKKGHDMLLDQEQEELMQDLDGIIMSDAVPGSGKTTSVSGRVVNMLFNGIKPESIFVVTFTNNAAKEMMDRIKRDAIDMECDEGVSKVTGTTFNAFGDTIIRDHFKEFGFTREPRLIDDIEKAGVVDEILKGKDIHGLDFKNMYMNLKKKGALYATISIFEIAKRHFLGRGDGEQLKEIITRDHNDLLCSISDERVYGELLDLYEEYDAKLKELNLIEYADQEAMIKELLSRNPYYFEDAPYEHIIVDEAQDMNELQLEMLKAMANTSHFKSMLFVGDDSQSIYKFRGSDPKLFINLWDNLGIKGKTVNLVKNHRSLDPIVKFAEQLDLNNSIRVNKRIMGTRGAGEKVEASAFWGDDELEDYTVDAIKKELAKGKEPSDIAIIKFKRAELLKIGSRLTEEGIPWVMLNPEPMLDNSRVRAAIALAEFASDTGATKAGFTYLNCAENNTLLTNTDDVIKEKLTGLAEVVSDIVAKNDVEAYKELLEKLDTSDEVYKAFLNSLYRRKTLSLEKKNRTQSLIGYSLDFLKFGERQAIKRTANYPGVVLTTAHSSKGLEFNTVIVDVTGFHTDKMGYEATDEKRRLFYVAATRAKDKLYITGKKIAFGPKKDRTYNKFLIETFDILNLNLDLKEPTNKAKEKAAA